MPARRPSTCLHLGALPRPFYSAVTSSLTCCPEGANACYFSGQGLSWSLVKLASLQLFLGVALVVNVRADLTIVQKVEGLGPSTEMTIKVKGSKVRVDASTQVTTILDGKS